jgi:hypothetical protein
MVTKTVDGLDEATLCPKIRMHAFEFPGGDRPFLVYKKDCAEGRCKDCPINSMLSMKCDVEWDDSESSYLHSFEKISKGKNKETLKEIYKTEFTQNDQTTQAQQMESFFGTGLDGKGGMLWKDQAHKFQIQMQYQSRILHEFHRCDPLQRHTHATKI